MYDIVAYTLEKLLPRSVRVNVEAVANVTAMGFPEAQAQEALQVFSLHLCLSVSPYFVMS